MPTTKVFLTRDKLNVPLKSDNKNIFEDPHNPSEKYYVQQYRIATRTVSGREEFRVALDLSDTGGNLTVYLEEIQEENNVSVTDNAKKMPVEELKVTLAYQSIQHDFQEITFAEHGIKAVLRLNKIEVTQLHQAITNNEYKTSLVISQDIKVALPGLSPDPVSSLVNSGEVQINLPSEFNPNPYPGYFLSFFYFDFDSGTKFTGELGRGESLDFDVKGELSYSEIHGGDFLMTARIIARFFRGNVSPKSFDEISAADLQSEIGYIDRKKLHSLGSDSFTSGFGRKRPIFCLRTNNGNYTKIEIISYSTYGNDHKCSFRWVTYNIPQHFEVKTIGHEQILAPHPFTFSPDLDPYIFPHVRPEQVMIPHRVEWKNKGYIYFQKRTDPHEIYYLPDSFKLPRTPDSPHHLMMAVRFQQTGTEPEDMEVTLDYAAAPFTDEQRIKAANIELSRKLDGELSADQPLIFIPVQHVDSDNIIYKLGLPRTDAADGVFRERQDEHALVSMDGIRDQLSLTLEDFQVIFDAMFSGDESILFQGKVEINMGDGSADSHTIPFAARIEDTVGDIFHYSESYDATTQETGVTLTNAVESPVRINSLSAVLRRAGNQVDAEVRRIDSEIPAELAPGEEISFTLAPSGPLAGEGACTISFDMHNVQVLPDKEAILNSIIDPTVPAEYTRKITIRTFEQVLTDNRAEAVVVELENGDTAVLESAALKTESIVRYPVIDLVLRRELPGGGCRYRLNVVQVSGQHPGPWQTSNSSTLFITSDMVAEALEAE